MLKINTISNGRIFITGDVDIESGDIVLSKDIGTSTLFVRKTNIDGVFTYGSRCNVEDRVWNKPAGYVWASRCGVMNKEFDIALIEIYYSTEKSHCNKCASIDLAHLEQLLVDTEYEINWEPTVDESDVCYEVVRKSV